MMNTKIYKSVHDLAEELMKAASKEDQVTFDALYAELEGICIDNESTEKDHPVQWETLADFTEDLEDAVAGYAKALEKSIAINSKDHISSVAYSMATLQIELGQTDAAIENLQTAKTSANKIEDKELKGEIDELLERLL
jgi:predicted negative regulator of RcsB-dependent stress response